MWKCEQCGSVNDDDNDFCPTCGRLPSKKKSIQNESDTTLSGWENISPQHDENVSFPSIAYSQHRTPVLAILLYIFAAIGMIAACVYAALSLSSSWLASLEFLASGIVGGVILITIGRILDQVALTNERIDELGAKITGDRQ